MWFFCHYSGHAISILIFSGLYIFHSGIIHSVQFPFWHFPNLIFLSFSWVEFFCHFQGGAISILAFSRVCIFHSSKFQLCILCHFLGCDFSVIFHSCIFQVWFSVIWGVYFLSFSRLCIFHSGIFQVMHFHSGSFQVVQFPSTPRLTCLLLHWFEGYLTSWLTCLHMQWLEG